MKRNVVKLDKRSAVVRDLHSKKYRQRVVRDKRRKHLNEDVEDDVDFDSDLLDDIYSDDDLPELKEKDHE